VTVTLPPPTATAIPTPTLHPEFILLQELISTSSGRFTLLPDGIIEDNGAAISGLRVFPDGVMTLTVDGEVIPLDPSKAVFDDENGFSYPGYELDDNGEWVEAISQAVLNAQAEFKDYGFPIDGLEFIGDDNGVRVVDPETEVEIYNNGEWDVFSFREKGVEADLFAPTKYTPLPASQTNGVWNRLPGTPTDQTRTQYFSEVLLKQFTEYSLSEYGINPYLDENGQKRGGVAFLLNPDTNAWGMQLNVNFGDGLEKALVFQLKNGEVKFIKLLSVFRDQIVYYWREQSNK
jgi:hypothetical protein